VAEIPLPELAQLRERVRDLEQELARVRGAAPGEGGDTQRLLESEERFRVAFATTPAALAITRVSDGRLMFVNAAFCRNAGRTEEEIVGRTFEELGIYADEVQRQRVFDLIIAHGFIENEEFRYKNSAGEERVGLLSSRPITIGGEMYQLGMTVDITAAKRAEAERNKLEEQLRQAQKMEAIGRLAGGVAHDFNNMLTAISANVELGLMAVREIDPVHELLCEIRDAATRAAKLTAQMLAFSRKQVIEPRALDLSQQVDAIRGLLLRLLGEDVSIGFDLATALPAVLADPNQLEQVILNLVINARDAVRGRGAIQIATRAAVAGEVDGRSEPFVVLSVKDDGPGIANEVLPHVFEPFFTTKAGGGTGLGLSTVHGIVTQHGGVVRVETSAAGTTFDIFLPAAPSGAPSVAPSRRPSQRPAPQGVLVLAEDDAAVREPTKALLERLGFTVYAASSGPLALAKVQELGDGVDVLLTDMVMPAMSGRQLAAAARDVVRALAVVMMSGYPEDVIAQGGVLDPSVVLLRKPFGASELLEAIDRARRQRA